MRSMQMKMVFQIIAVILSTSIYSQTLVKIPEFKKSTQVFVSQDRTWETAFDDLNNDGYLDAVFTDLGSASQILFNDGKGYFKDSGQKLAGSTHGIAIGDLDNDGDKDLFFALLTQDNSAIYRNNGNGIFERSNIDLSVGASERIQLIDIDNDGDLDAYFWWRGLLYLNDGKGNFRKSNTSLPEFPSFSDLNNDGSVDILSAIPGKGFKIYTNDKKGNFREYFYLNKIGIKFCYTGFTDIDNDNDIDVIFSNGDEEVRHPASVLLNDGSGILIDSGQKLSSAEYGFIGIGDLNDDGYMDVIITDRQKPSRIWMNNGKGVFFDSGISLGEEGLWNNCTIRDFDNDGDMDVFITKVAEGSHGLWFNQLMESKKKIKKL